MRKRDHYVVLGIQPDASAEQIRRAYLEQARRLHPDSGGHGASHEGFVELQEAYDCLSDSECRRRYDRERALAAARAADLARVLRDPRGRRSGSLFDELMADEPWVTLSNIFTGLGFDRLARPANPPRGELAIEVLVTEEQARAGADVTIRVPRSSPCGACRGSGDLRCHVCGGHGEVTGVQPVMVKVPPFEGRETTLHRTIADRRHGGLDLEIRVRIGQRRD